MGENKVKALVKTALVGIALAGFATTASAGTLACLITKNNTNPFFVKMKEGAEAAATAEIGRASCRERV